MTVASALTYRPVKPDELTACAQVWRIYFHSPEDPTVCRDCGNPLTQPPDPQRRDEILERIANHRDRIDPLAAHYQATDRFLTVSGAGDYDQVAERLKAALPS